MGQGYLGYVRTQDSSRRSPNGGLDLLLNIKLRP